MPHVAHVVLSLDSGGLERVVLNLVREGLRLGQRVSVVCVERLGSLAAAVEAAGATVRCVGKPPGLRPGTVKHLRCAFEELGPDVVHTHQVGALFYAGPAARRAGVPVVVHTEHGKHYDASWRTRWLGRIAARHAQKYFCVSADIAAGVRRHWVAPARKVEVVANGIDTAKFAVRGDPATLRASMEIPPDAPVIGTVGNLREVKRQDVLIRGFARLGQDGPAAPHLLLVGDGALMGDLTRLAADLGVERRVHFAGHQADPERFLHAMDIFALTSRSEGMPLAILEAWAAGLPVVASNVGGIPELIREGETGFLFEPLDDRALAARLAALLADRDAARRVGEAAREEVVTRYDVGVMAAAYHRHYLELLGRAGVAVEGAAPAMASR